MEIVYSLGGRPFKMDDDRLWNRRGEYVGKIVDERVFSSDGLYLGEFRNERLAYKLSNSSKRKGPHMARMNRSATSRSDRSARSVPSGWEDFHG